jgi:ADP-heptose:LPS heptosyltransferase
MDSSTWFVNKKKRPQIKEKEKRMSIRQDVLFKINDAVNYLRNIKNNNPKYIIKIAKNAGDTCHGQPIIRHIKRTTNANIVFMVCEKYKNIHELNSDISQIITLPNDIDDKTRLAIWPELKKHNDINVIIPAINPFRSQYKQNDWSTNDIVSQYLHNASIPVNTPYRYLSININNEDIQYAKTKLSNIKLNKTVAIEYISYSSKRAWDNKKYQTLVDMLNKNGYSVISIAGRHENPLNNTINCCGSTWRQAVAILSNVKHVVGCASGISVLASATKVKPMIYELNVPDNVTIKNCRYADSINIKAPSPEIVFDCIRRYNDN